MRRLRRKIRLFAKLALCFVLASLIALDPNILQIWMARAQTTATDVPLQSAPDPAELKSKLKKLAKRMEKMFAALEEAQKEIPRDTFDPEVIIHGQKAAGIEGVGKDPKKIFEWVRDKTYLVPYRGALRDYKGVLMDRVGNSLDRSLLLMMLLYEAGHKKVQLAYAKLPEEKAAELLKKARAIPKTGSLPQRQASPEKLAAQLKRHAKEHDLDAADIQRAIDKMQLKSQRLAMKAVQRTHEQSQILLKMLRKKDLVPSREEQIKKLRAEAIKNFRHHWWVQWHKGGGLIGGKLVDLDPSLPDAQPGDTIAKAQRIVPGTELTDRLWNERHTVQIRIIIERWDDGELTEVPVLSQELFPAAVIGERIAIHHAPIQWPKKLDLLKHKKPLEKLKEVVLDQSEWMPVLTVGDQRIAKYSFTDSGLINQPGLPGFVKNVLAGRQMAEGLENGAQIMGGFIKGVLSGTKTFGGKPRNPETNDDLQHKRPVGESQLTAEWIEYEIRAPGEEPQKIRRQIFDLLGPAAREKAQNEKDRYVAKPEFSKEQRLNRSLALLGHTNILPLTAQLPPDYLAHVHVQALLDNEDTIPEILRAAGSQDLAAVIQQIRNSKPFPSQLYSLALARDRWSSQQLDIHAASVDILAFHEYVSMAPSNQMAAYRAFDIVNNAVAIRPNTDSNPFLVRFEQGVLDTNAEALLLNGGGRLKNTAEMFRNSSAPKSQWTVIESKDSPILSNGSLPKDVCARIRHELTNGQVVIAPTSGIDIEGHEQFGWWRIKPDSGVVLGIGQRGWGQTATEWALAVAVVLPGVIAATGAIYNCLGGSETHSNWKLIACGLCAGFAFLGGIVAGILALFPGTVSAGATYAILLTDLLYTGTLCTLASVPPDAGLDDQQTPED